MNQAGWNGFILGLSLIVAIGAQNAFVLKQGIRREWVFLVCSICSVSDAILMGFGVFGFHQLLLVAPWVDDVARVGGTLFLVWYAYSRFRAAYLGEEFLAIQQKESNQSQKMRPVVLTTLAFTWLNPHVYLDTLVLVGSVSANYQHDALWFWFGTCMASVCFFFALGYGARMLSPIFQKPIAWRILDGLIGCLMLWIVFQLWRG
jgi:L-lysine exporter family protein LysE/ArgO